MTATICLHAAPAQPLHPSSVTRQGKETRLVLVLVAPSRPRADPGLAGAAATLEEKLHREALPETNPVRFSSGALGGDSIATCKYLQRTTH